MAKRTDIHSTSKIDPAAYTFIACDYHGGGLEGMAYMSERIMFRDHMNRHGGKWAHITRTDGEDGSCGCYICGAHCSYVAKFWHKETNTYIETGMDCAMKMDMGDRRMFDSFRKKIRAGIEAQAGKNKAMGILADAGMSQAWEIYVAEYDTLPKGYNGDVAFEENTIRDIVGKLVKYGSVSEKQTAFALKLLAKINDRARVQAEREARDENRKPVPVLDKRLTIAGVIISAKYEPADWVNGFHRSAACKVTIEHADGWRVFGNLPLELWEDCKTHGEMSWHNGACIDDGTDIDSSKLKGRTVQFDARIQPSDRDAKFGFFKRPTKAKFCDIRPVDASVSEALTVAA
jgi:hypothetical protein